MHVSSASRNLVLTAIRGQQQWTPTLHLFLFLSFLFVFRDKASLSQPTECRNCRHTPFSMELYFSFLYIAHTLCACIHPEEALMGERVCTASPLPDNIRRQDEMSVGERAPSSLLAGSRFKERLCLKGTRLRVTEQDWCPVLASTGAPTRVQIHSYPYDTQK